MKMLSVILALIFAAQPLQAGFCAMEPSGSPAQQADTQHAGPQPGQMQHDSMQHAKGRPGSDHGCCASPDVESNPGCDTLDQCGSCMAGTAAVPALNAPFTVRAFSCLTMLCEDQVAPSHASPPFRPPTTIS